MKRYGELFHLFWCQYAAIFRMHLKYDENIYACTREMSFYSTVIGKVMAETGEAEIDLLQFYR